MGRGIPRSVSPVIVRCNNPKCITNHEKVGTLFVVVEDNPLKLRCRYCERAMCGDEIELV